MHLAKLLVIVLGACLPLAASADPLDIMLHLNGSVTGTGTPLVQSFSTEVDTEWATLAPGSATTRFGYFWSTALTADGQTRSFYPSDQYGQFALQDNFRNAAGQIVDTFDLVLPAFGSERSNALVTAHLEFAPDTFSAPNGQTILALPDAAILQGNYVMQAYWMDWSGGVRVDHVEGTLTSLDAEFYGPGAVPSVPEPGQFALVLAGLTAVALRRRWRGSARG